jgi:hypothetical protein
VLISTIIPVLEVIPLKQTIGKLTPRERGLLYLLRLAFTFFAYVVIAAYWDVYDAVNRVMWWAWVVCVPIVDAARLRDVIQRIRKNEL